MRDFLDGHPGVEIIERDDGLLTIWFDLLLVSPAEMQELLMGTGWAISPRTEGPTSLYVAVLEKPDSP